MLYHYCGISTTMGKRIFFISIVTCSQIPKKRPKPAMYSSISSYSPTSQVGLWLWASSQVVAAHNINLSLIYRCTFIHLASHQSVCQSVHYSKCKSTWCPPLVCSLPFWNLDFAITVIAILVSLKPKVHMFGEVVAGEQTHCRACILIWSDWEPKDMPWQWVSCQSHGSHALKHSLLYCLSHSKWDHNLQNERNIF